MKFLIDNALSPLVAERLRQNGHDAVHVRDYGMAAANDDLVFARAAGEGRILVSVDTDFSTMLALRQVREPSVILLGRSADRDPEKQLALLLVNLPGIQQALERGCIVVFDETRLRMRTLPIGGAELP